MDKPTFEQMAEFEAVLKKLQTIKGGDGAFRLTLDIPMIYKKEMAKLFDLDTESEIVRIILFKVLFPQPAPVEEEAEKPRRERKKRSGIN